MAHTVREGIAPIRSLAALLHEQALDAERIGLAGGQVLRLVLWAEDCERVADQLEEALADPALAAWDEAWGRVELTYEGHSTGVLLVSAAGVRHAIGNTTVRAVESALRERGMSFRSATKASFHRTVVDAWSWPRLEAFLHWLDGAQGPHEAESPGGRRLPDALRTESRQDIHRPEWKPTADELARLPLAPLAVGGPEDEHEASS